MKRTEKLHLLCHIGEISNRVGKSETFFPIAQSGGDSLTGMRHGVQNGIPAFT